LDSLREYVIPQDLGVTVTRNYGETAKHKSDELLKHLLIATLSLTPLIALALGWRESGVEFKPPVVMDTSEMKTGPRSVVENRAAAHDWSLRRESVSENWRGSLCLGSLPLVCRADSRARAGFFDDSYLGGPKPRLSVQDHSERAPLPAAQPPSTLVRLRDARSHTSCWNPSNCSPRLSVVSPVR
jgi:hypothetical protein